MKDISRRDFLAHGAMATGFVVGRPSAAWPIFAPQRSDLLDLTATAAVAAMKSGDIKAEQYARALLDAASRLSSLNAFRAINPDAVLEAARTADKGRASNALLGALHGLPVPVKDSVNTTAYTTTNGTRALADFRPRTNAAVITRLLSTGAFVMGKTNLHELSLGYSSTNPTFGAVHNPYDRTRVPGGSSGGSAAAVAARMAPLAIAEDTLGSIRIPATMCGICGFRPTHGRYPNDGTMPLTQDKFDQVGPVARSVEDLALFDSAITRETVQLQHVELRNVRIGVAEYFLTDLDPEVERVTNAAVHRLRDAGVTIVRAEIPEEVKGASAAAIAIIRAELAPAMRTFLSQEAADVSLEDIAAQAGTDVKGFLTSTVPPNYEAMLAQRSRISEVIRSYFASNNLDALCFPPALTPAFEIGKAGRSLARNVSHGSVSGMASLVLPAGVTSAGLPVGLEFDSLPGTDRRLLAIGVSLQRALGPIPAPED